MLSLNNENINYAMTQNLKLSCVSFSYVNISYVLAEDLYKGSTEQENKAGGPMLSFTNRNFDFMVHWFKLLQLHKLLICIRLPKDISYLKGYS